jgi:hypothetical protein
VPFSYSFALQFSVEQADRKEARDVGGSNLGLCPSDEARTSSRATVRLNLLTHLQSLSMVLFPCLLISLASIPLKEWRLKLTRLPPAAEYGRKKNRSAVTDVGAAAQ